MTTIYEVWIKEVYRVISLRFKGDDVDGFKSSTDWRSHYDNQLTAHEAVTISCG